MRIIGLLGVAGSGKDTAGQFLVQEGAYSLALADPLKLFCMWMFDWTPEQLWGPSEQRNKADPRLPFFRCPACGFHWPDTAHEVLRALADSAEYHVCPICYATRDPREWLATLSPRFALQDLGTEWARYFYQQCHVDFALRRATAVQERITNDPLYYALPECVRKDRMFTPAPPAQVYISDCRFKNEVEAIRAAGGRVFRIVRPAATDTTTTGMPNHASETEQLEIKDEELDGVISNTGSLDALRERIKDIVTEP